LFVNRGATVKTNFIVENLSVSVNNISTVLFTNSVSGTPDADFIVIDKLTGFPSSTNLHNTSSYDGFPHRCQKQTGRQTLTATSGTSSTLDISRSFKYIYPRAPSAQATTIGAVAGNRPVMASFDALTASAYTLQVQSPDLTNWTATSNRVVCWTASIDEV